MQQRNASVPLAPSNRLHNAFYPQDPSFPLTLLHVLSAPLHGLANAFVFGLDRDWWSLLSPTGVQVQQLHTQARSDTRTAVWNLTYTLMSEHVAMSFFWTW